ncbi:hypothetical protein M3647_21155 [Paenibacillus cellulositrophicus]|uniref:hypothetical protein n=1 Tax=Paenibacillus cellulositrophicus TaxID=562959 RepID=UPI00203F105F|nr:hypothetical protein [Paenibacillus cellulositrophicus]MCM2999987.1 hypothetical protein [Paenibacillus cellulositrophicus]
MLEKSYLVPQREGQLLDFEVWDEHTSNEHKWEFWDGHPFAPAEELPFERDRLLICLLYSCGLDYFVNELLPDQSKEILLKLLQEDQRKGKQHG